MSLLTVEQAARLAGTVPWIVVAAMDNKKLESISLDRGELRTTRDWVERWRSIGK